MIEGVSDLEALQKERQLEAEHALKSAEIQRISERLVFKGEKIKSNDFVKYFNQFGGPFDQRRIFNLVNSIYYISKSDISDFFIKEKKSIFFKHELSLSERAKTPYRESVELYSFHNTIKENEELVATFKRLTYIRSTKTLKSISENKDAWRISGSEDIVIIESVIDDYSEISTDLNTFLNQDSLLNKVPVKLLVLLITTKAKADLITATSSYSNFRLIHFREIEESKIKPFIDTTEIFENKEESRFVFAEVKKTIHQTPKDSINVLFESHCPSKAIPIYWHASKQFSPIFLNSHGTLSAKEKEHDSEIFRDLVYHTNKDFIQAINPFLIKHLKSKAIENGDHSEENWFKTDFLSGAIIKKINEKWVEENCAHSKESYFDLIDYKEIVKKNKELLPIFKFQEGGGNGLEWIDKVNEIRRKAAHPEKPTATKDEAEFYEKKKVEILQRILLFDKN